MTLWFENSYGDARIVAQCKTTDEVYKAINKFIKDANARKPKGAQPFKSYYMRTWEQDGKTWYDVGSHTEFFFTTKESHE